MNKSCNFCRNKNFKEKHVQYIYKHDDRFLVVNNVPCEECEYCGEQYFKAEVLKKKLRNISEKSISQEKESNEKLRYPLKNL